MPTVKTIIIEKSGDYHEGAANNDIKLAVNYNSQNETIDLIGSCKIRENYIIPSPITIKNLYSIEFSNQIGLLYLKDNLIYYVDRF